MKEMKVKDRRKGAGERSVKHYSDWLQRWK